MPRLIYTAITSLDGYINDADGNFDWSEPDGEVHAHVNDAERAIGTYLYGRRLYEVMLAWETMPTGNDQPVEIRDYAELWRATDKVVYSTTLEATASERTRLERSFDPDTIRELKESADRDISIGGAGLAAHAFGAGLIDEVGLYLNPIVVGGGTTALPDDVRVRLELLDERRFGNGVVHLRYRVGHSTNNKVASSSR